MKNNTFDLIIIGGGPAGYTAAIRGSLQGFKVALVERDQIGGACINRGCIPTKALWGTAVALQRLADLEQHGITIGSKIEFDFSKAVKRQYAITDQMSSTIRKRMLALGTQVFQADAFVESYDPKRETERFTVSLKSKGGSSKLTSKFVLIATGSRPAESDVLKADHQKVLNTDDIVLLNELPKSLTIVGGGVVACEFASILNRFGVEIHLLEHSSQVLSAMDQEIVGLLMQQFESNGIKIHLHTKVRALRTSAQSVQLELESDGKTSSLETEAVLLAIGRRPNSEGIGLEQLSVKLTPRGHVVVDEQLQTACKGLFAGGDVVGGQMLAHKAWYDASIAVRAMCGEECRTNYDTVPGAIFTIPEMASVGLQPDQARQKGIAVAIGKYTYAENSQALCVGRTKGMVKAVIDRDTGKVIGCTIFGHDSSNLISEVALAIQTGLTAKQIGDTIHPHPTLSEMICESFLDSQGLSVHKGT
ncbi:MAG: dihydrolipoyl dehydrogenase [Bdellovibrionota bacterium]